MDNTTTGNTGTANWDEIRKYLEQYNTQESKSVCPHCGYCPHCGRGGYYSRPYRPWYDDPYTITWTSADSGFYK